MELFARGGLNDEGGMIDEESGNKVPVGGTREGVRDDIDANVSEGEFIFSEDVTRYIGLDKLMRLRQEAKMGLQKMESMGQMGNSDEATMDDDMPFGMDDLIIVAGGEPDDGEINMAVGGLATGTTNVVRTPDPVASVANQTVTPLGTSTRRLTPEITQPVRTTVDFKKLMGDAAIEYKEYRNAAGNNILVPFIGGKATFPIPDGYTLYTGTDAVGGGTTPTDNIVSDANTATQERRSNNDDRTNAALPTPEAIDWDNLSYEEYMDKSSTLVGTGRTFAKAATLFMGPLAIFPMAAMAHQDKKALLGATKLLNSGLLNAEQIAALEARTAGINKHGGGLVNNLLGNVFGGVIDAVAGALGKLPEEVDAVKKVAVETGIKVDPTPTVFLPQNTGMPLTKAILPPAIEPTNTSPFDSGEYARESSFNYPDRSIDSNSRTADTKGKQAVLDAYTPDATQKVQGGFGVTPEVPLDITETSKLDITKAEPIAEEKTGLGAKVSKPKQAYKAGQSNQATAWENLPDVNLGQAYELSERYKVTGGTTVDNYVVGAVSDGSSTGILSDDQGFAIRSDNGRNVFVDEQGEYHRPTWGEMIKNGRNFKQRDVGNYDKNTISVASTDRVSTVTAGRKNELSPASKAKIGKDASGGDPSMKGAVWYNEPGTNILTRKFPTAAEKKKIKAEQAKEDIKSSNIQKTKKAVEAKKAEDARIRAESIRKANEVYAQQQAAKVAQSSSRSSRDRRKKQQQAQTSATNYTKSAISRNAGADGKVTKDTYRGGGF